MLLSPLLHAAAAWHGPAHTRSAYVAASEQHLLAASCVGAAQRPWLKRQHFGICSDERTVAKQLDACVHLSEFDLLLGLLPVVCGSWCVWLRAVRLLTRSRPNWVAGHLLADSQLLWSVVFVHCTRIRISHCIPPTSHSLFGSGASLHTTTTAAATKHSPHNKNAAHPSCPAAESIMEGWHPQNQKHQQ